MRLLTAIVVLSASPWFSQFAFGQVVPSSPSGGPVVQFNGPPGFGYQYSPSSGQSTSLYDMGNGMTGYTSRDASGRITGQGTLYNAAPRPQLEVPPYVPLTPGSQPSR